MTMRTSLRAGASRVKRSATRAFRKSEDARLTEKYRDYTMVAAPRFIDNLTVARRAQGLPGHLVECGTWRGGMIAAMSEALAGRTSILFDSFEGLPPANAEKDGDHAIAFQRNGTSPNYHDNCRAERDWAEKAMALSRQQFRIFQGWFDDTVPQYAAEDPTIAVLRLDGDWYDSTMVCLEHLYPLVVEGGMVLVDDYDAWEGCTRAVHDYLSRNALTCQIRSMPSGVTYFVKR